MFFRCILLWHVIHSTYPVDKVLPTLFLPTFRIVIFKKMLKFSKNGMRSTQVLHSCFLAYTETETNLANLVTEKQRAFLYCVCLDLLIFSCIYNRSAIKTKLKMMISNAMCVHEVNLHVKLKKKRTKINCLKVVNECSNIIWGCH